MECENCGKWIWAGSSSDSGEPYHTPGILCPNCDWFNELEEPEFPEEQIMCQAQDCNKAAVYEGWYKNQDFSGNTTGQLIKGYVCEEHKHYLLDELPF